MSQDRNALSKRRLKPLQNAGLGMKVEARKPSPYDPMARRMEAGIPEEERLEQQGRKKVKPYSARSQKRIPRVNPAGPAKGGRA